LQHTQRREAVEATDGLRATFVHGAEDIVAAAVCTAVIDARACNIGLHRCEQCQRAGSRVEARNVLRKPEDQHTGFVRQHERAHALRQRPLALLPRRRIVLPQQGFLDISPPQHTQGVIPDDAFAQRAAQIGKRGRVHRSAPPRFFN